MNEIPILSCLDIYKTSNRHVTLAQCQDMWQEIQHSQIVSTFLASKKKTPFWGPIRKDHHKAVLLYHIFYSSLPKPYISRFYRTSSDDLDVMMINRRFLNTLHDPMIFIRQYEKLLHKIKTPALIWEQKCRTDFLRYSISQLYHVFSPHQNYFHKVKKRHYYSSYESRQFVSGDIIFTRQDSKFVYGIYHENVFSSDFEDRRMDAYPQWDVEDAFLLPWKRSGQNYLTSDRLYFIPYDHEYNVTEYQRHIFCAIKIQKTWYAYKRRRVQFRNNLIKNEIIEYALRPHRIMQHLDENFNKRIVTMFGQLETSP